jgi:hypothetical protein
MMMVEAVRTSETSVDNYFTQQYTPEDNSEQPTLSVALYRYIIPVVCVSKLCIQTANMHIYVHIRVREWRCIIDLATTENGKRSVRRKFSNGNVDGKNREVCGISHD